MPRFLLCSALLFIACCASPSDEPLPASSEVDLQPEAQGAVDGPDAATAHANLPPIAPLEDGVVLEIEVSKASSGRPILSGRTNLPDGTTIMLGVSGSDTGFNGGESTEVEGTTFIAGPFGPARGLDPGRYVASAVMPYPLVQSASVKAVIGEDGEHLRGALVERKELGPTVRVETAFQVGDDAEAAVSRRRHSEALVEAEAIFKELESVIAAGRRMEPLRGSQALPTIRRCGEAMATHQSDVKALGRRAEAMPEKPARIVGAAVNVTNLCVSCLGSGGDHCDVAETAIEDGRLMLE